MVASLSAALARLDQGGIDVVFSDLGWPDSDGLSTFAQLHARAPEVPIIVLTGHNDEMLAMAAVRAGAQDYLVKGQVTGPLLMRAARYAVERQHLLEELAQARQRQQQARELSSLERLSGSSSTTVTAELYHLAPLSKVAPEKFDDWVQRYEGVLEQALEQRAFKVHYHTGETLRALAEELGFLKAGPRDVVELHVAALQAKTRTAPNARSAAYAEEGRLMVLELMGYLADYYRYRALGNGLALHPGNQTE